jgi:hypothetical protein
VAVKNARPQYDVYVVTAPIAEDIGCNGFSAAMMVTTSRGSEISLHTGRGPEMLARHLVEKLEREYFTNRCRN